MKLLRLLLALPVLGVVVGVAYVAQATESAEARRLLAAFDAAPFAPPDVSDRPEDRELVRALVRAGDERRLERLAEERQRDQHGDQRCGADQDRRA